MTQNETDIIKREVAARLPYGLMVKYDLGNSYPYPKIGCVYLWHHNGFCSIYMVDKYPENWFPPVKSESVCHWENVRPYLRPLTEMTEQERISFYEYCLGYNDDDFAELTKFGNDIQPPFTQFATGYALIENVYRFSDIAHISEWFNQHHFDYTNLIGRGLALTAPEGMYNSFDVPVFCNK